MSSFSSSSVQTVCPVLHTDGLSGRRRALAIAVIVCGLALCVLDTTMLNLALPSISAAWGLEPAQALWVVNAGQIIPLMVLLPLSALGDRLGYHRIYLGGMGLFGLASILSALAPALPWLVAGRALQGLGVAAVLSVNTALVREIYPQSLLGRGIALNSMVVAISTVSGPVIAAAVLSVADWRMLFCLHVPLVLCVWSLGRKVLPVRPGPAQRRGWSVVDVLLNMAMFGGVFLALDRLTHHGHWGGVVAGLSLGLVCGWRYVRRQRGLAHPMLPLDLLRQGFFQLSIASSMGAFCAQTIAFLALPFLLMQAYGLSVGETGWLLTAWPLALACTAPWVGRRIGRIPSGWLGGAGMALFAIGLGLLATLPVPASGWSIAWRLALCGAGFGLFQSPNNHAFVTSAPRQRSGAASGLLGSARHAGQCLGALCLAATFMLSPPVPGLAELSALWLAAGFALLAAICSTLRISPRSNAGPAE